MLKFMKYTAFVMVLFLPDISAAKERIDYTVMNPEDNTSKCKMVETVTLSLSYNNIPIELSAINDFLEVRTGEIMATAKALGVESLILNNIGYNVYSNYSGVGKLNYMLGGNVSMQLDNAQQATKLMEAFVKEGYVPNMNVNSYRQCP